MCNKTQDKQIGHTTARIHHDDDDDHDHDGVEKKTKGNAAIELYSYYSRTKKNSPFNFKRFKVIQKSAPVSFVELSVCIAFDDLMIMAMLCSEYF